MAAIQALRRFDREEWDEQKIFIGKLSTRLAAAGPARGG
jgi:hypothetical protein